MMDIRLEYKLSQKLMSENLGVSKKTYIQLEKQRTVLKWSEAVTLATIFMNSKILQDEFNEDIISVIHGVVFDQKNIQEINYSIDNVDVKGDENVDE